MACTQPPPSLGLLLLLLLKQQQQQSPPISLDKFIQETELRVGAGYASEMNRRSRRSWRRPKPLPPGSGESSRMGEHSGARRAQKECDARRRNRPDEI
uniref:Secreted protein n=1 Tax=Aegilops tauschii TaxID=37682 RepID=R7W766_AEGTA